MKKLLNEGECLYEYIPPGATGLLQPLDTHINKDFKERMRKKFEAWYDLTGCSDSNKTAKGYLRAPSISLATTWALEAWQEVPHSLVENSFKYCGTFAPQNLFH